MTQHTPTEAEDEDEDEDEDEADTVDGDFASEPELPPFPEVTHCVQIRWSMFLSVVFMNGCCISQ